MRIKVQPFSIFLQEGQPGRPGQLEILAFISAVFEIIQMLFCCSFMVTFPVLVSLMVEATLKRLQDFWAQKLRKGETGFDEIDEFTTMYKDLSLQVSRVDEKMRKALILIFLVLGGQQFAQSYCTFKLIEMGLSFDEISLYFLDMIVRCKRNFGFAFLSFLRFALTELSFRLLSPDSAMLSTFCG